MNYSSDTPLLMADIVGFHFLETQEDETGQL